MSSLFILRLDEYVENLGKYDEFKKYYEKFEPFYDKIKDIYNKELESIIFGNPDKEQQEMIDSWDDDFKEKMKGVLKFSENTIEITLQSGKKLKFPKEQPIKDDLTWNKSIQKAKEVGMRSPTKEEFEELFKIFIGDDEIINLRDILGINDLYYWSSNSDSDNRYFANLCGSGVIHETSDDYILGSICIQD